jgi:hypothetical protein
MNRDGKEVVGVGRVYLTYHGDGNVGIGTPPQVASAPLGEPVEHLRVSMTDGVGITPKDMNREEIIRMAREAGLDPDLWNYTDAFDYFAYLVAEHEREAIWNLLFEYAGRDDLSDSDQSLLKHLLDLIAARWQEWSNKEGEESWIEKK